jgi:hypothetical protein
MSLSRRAFVNNKGLFFVKNNKGSFDTMEAKNKFCPFSVFGLLPSMVPLLTNYGMIDFLLLLYHLCVVIC